MKTLFVIIGAICLSISVQAQSNIFDIKFTYTEGILIAGKNKSIVYPAGAKNTMLAKTWGQPSCPTPTIGDIVRFTQVDNKSAKNGESVCEWVIKSVVNLGPVAKDVDGMEDMKTGGTFIKMTFVIKNISQNTLYLDSDFMQIRMKKNSKDNPGNPQMPYSNSHRIVGEDESFTVAEIPSELSRVCSIVYEIPQNITMVAIPVFSINSGVILKDYKIRDSSRILLSFPTK